jgi:LPS-assembly protein
MILKKISSFLLTSILVIFSFSGAFAEPKQPVGLLADAVDYDASAQLLTAKGNVRIVSDGQVLSADTVVYNQATGRLTIPDGFTITTADGSILTGENAELSSDLSKNVIKGARLLIASQFQMAADQAQYKDNRFKVLDRVVASTCYICKSNPIPFWQIRSNRVVHDELTKQLYFEHARLEFLGIPVLYAPRLRLPDPTVDRATGFLVPSFLTSDILKFGAKIPYFIAIDDHSDATVTAFVSTVGSFVTELEYRRETKRGYYNFSGSILLIDGIDNNSFRSSLQGDGRFALKNNFEWGFEIDVASDKSYRAQYGYDDEDELTAQDRLFSEIYLEHNRKNSFFTVRAASIQSLRANEVDAQIPLVFPEVYYRKIHDSPIIGGKLGYSAHSTVLLRTGGSRFSTAGASIDWQREWQLRNGVLFSASGQLEGEYYSVSDGYTGFTGSTATRVAPMLSADLRLPLAKTVGASTHVIEPIIQLIWSEDSLSSTPNEDSVQVEFDETNLFSNSRFPGFDQKELGMRANVGINYALYNPSGWNYGATIGRIFRKDDLGQFTGTQSLSGQNSDWVTAFSIGFPSQFELTNRSLFDSDFNLSKNETSLNFVYEKIKGDATYLWLEKDLLVGRRSEAELELIFTPNDTWAYLAQWRHDFIANSAREGEFGIKYTNECVEIDLSLSLQYAASGIIGTTKELGLTISLIGIGNQASAKRRRHHCAF